MKKPAIPDTIQFGDEYGLLAHARLLERYAEILLQADYSALTERLKQSWSLVHGIDEDVRAISVLIRAGLPNAMYIVFRGFIEKIVTFLYLQVVEEDIYRDYWRYVLHKKYRKALESFTFITPKNEEVILKGEVKGDISEHSAFNDAIKRFTGASGKPKTRWESSSIDKRLQKLEAAGIIEMQFIKFLVWEAYDDASETLHATHYGSVAHRALLNVPIKTDSELQQSIREHLTTSLFAGDAALLRVVEWVLTLTKQDALLAEAREMNSLITQRMARALRPNKKPEGS
jgi:hypothetical protein